MDGNGRYKLSLIPPSISLSRIQNLIVVMGEILEIYADVYGGYHGTFNVTHSF
jgi:hypothetical protein